VDLFRKSSDGKVFIASAVVFINFEALAVGETDLLEEQHQTRCRLAKSILKTAAPRYYLLVWGGTLCGRFRTWWY